MDPAGKRDSDSDTTERDARRELSSEIEVRLGVRRKFYGVAFVLFTLVVLVLMVPAAWLNPQTAGTTLAASASAIIGTGVVLWWAYVVRKSALYEKAGRSLLRER
jgi:hypothetical protein